MVKDQDSGSSEPPTPARRGFWRKLLPGRFGKRPAVVAVVRLAGAIGLSSPLKPGLTIAGIAETLEQAFTLKRVAGVALAVNSPGGSPVQSVLIFKRIRALADEHKVPVTVFAEDVAASGGYMLACAGDEIYADDSSIIGSIGVVSASFGFDKLIGKYGIERRVHTQGRNKAMLDPFQPEKPDDVKRLKNLQKDVHESFIRLVRERRGVHFPEKDADLFTGEFWAGRKALELGLIDGLGDLRSVMRDKYGEDVKFKLVGQRRGWLQRRFGGMPGAWSGSDGPETLRAGLVGDVLSAIEERALWSRFGL